MERSEVAAALTHLTKGPGVFSTTLVRDLDDKLNALRRCWSITITSNDEVATNTVRRLIIGNVRPLIEQLKPRNAHQSRRPEMRIDQYQALVKACFNMPFSDEAPEFRPLRNMRSLTERRYWMQSNAPENVRIKVSVGQDDLKDAINKMADLITAAGYEPLTQVEDILPSPNEEDVLPAWIAEFNAQYGEGRTSNGRATHAASVYVEGRWVVLTFVGEQDSTNLYFYRDSMFDLYRLGKMMRLIIDIELEQMDAGLAGIMLGQYSLSRGNGGVLRLVTTRQDVYRFFKRMGIARRFDWYPDVPTAINLPVGSADNADDGFTEVIEFSHEIHDDYVIVRIVGELDMLAAEPLQILLNDLIASDCRNFILDLNGLSFVDSSGIRPIMVARRDTARRNGQVLIVADTPPASRVLDSIGYEPIFRTVEDALAVLNAPAE